MGAGFESEFQSRLTERGGLGPGADGFAFVLQNSGPDAVGGGGSAGGYALGDRRYYGEGAGIPRRIAIFFDTFRNPETRGPSDNFIAICTAGTPKKMRWPPPRLAGTRSLPVDLKDSEVHSARIVFQPPILSVYVDGLAVLSSAVDLATVVDSEGAA